MKISDCVNNPLKYIDPSGENWWSDFWGGVGDGWNGFWDYLNGTPNPQTGQNEGGLAQQVPSWVPDFSVGVNSSGQTFHTVGNSGPIYHNNNSYTIPGINFSEVYVPNNSSVGGMPTTGLYGEQLNLGGFQPSLDANVGIENFETPKEIGNGMGYLSGGFGLGQMSLMEYRHSLSIDSKIGTFSKFSSTYKGIGLFTRYLGYGGYLGSGLSFVSDINALSKGQIGLSRFGYRTSGLGLSVGVGASIGGPPGAFAGAVVGGLWWSMEYIYDTMLVPFYNEIQFQIWNTENALRNGWRPGR